jgi:hypothetical protein
VNVVGHEAVAPARHRAAAQLGRQQIEIEVLIARLEEDPFAPAGSLSAARSRSR